MFERELLQSGHNGSAPIEPLGALGDTFLYFDHAIISENPQIHFAVYLIARAVYLSTYLPVFVGMYYILFAAFSKRKEVEFRYYQRIHKLFSTEDRTLDGFEWLENLNNTYKRLHYELGSTSKKSNILFGFSLIIFGLTLSYVVHDRLGIPQNFEGYGAILGASLPVVFLIVAFILTLKEAGRFDRDAHVILNRMQLIESRAASGVSLMRNKARFNEFLLSLSKESYGDAMRLEKNPEGELSVRDMGAVASIISAIARAAK